MVFPTWVRKVRICGRINLYGPISDPRTRTHTTLKVRRLPGHFPSKPEEFARGNGRTYIFYTFLIFSIDCGVFRRYFQMRYKRYFPHTLCHFASKPEEFGGKIILITQYSYFSYSLGGRKTAFFRTPVGKNSFSTCVEYTPQYLYNEKRNHHI